MHQFGAYMKTLGFAKGTRFHSFRHRLINSLISKGYTTSQIALITGHSTTGQVREDEAPAIKGAYEGILPEQARPMAMSQLPQARAIGAQWFSHPDGGQRRAAPDLSTVRASWKRFGFTDLCLMRLAKQLIEMGLTYDQANSLVSQEGLRRLPTTSSPIWA